MHQAGGNMEKQTLGEIASQKLLEMIQRDGSS